MRERERECVRFLICYKREKQKRKKKVIFFFACFFQITVVMARAWLVLDKARRIVRTMFFMVAMVASLLVSSLPVLVAVADVVVTCVLISSFTCVRCYGFKEHLRRYDFKRSLTDIPLVSIIRSLIITCTIIFVIIFFINFIRFYVWFLGREEYFFYFPKEEENL